MGFLGDLWDKITAQPPTGKGTFRGVPFLIIDDANVSGGHRLVKHEFPMRDEGKVENMGRSMRAYSIYCVVIGDDYIDQKNALIEALEDPEPADLEHPYYGTEYVQIETWNVRESTREQRIAMIQITYVITQREESPEVETDGEAELLDESDSLLDGLADDFAAAWDMVEGTIADVEAAITFATNVVNNVTNMITGLSSLGGFSSLLGTVQGLQGSLKNLFNSPSKLASNLSNLFKGFSSSGKKSSAQRALRSTIVSVSNMKLSESPKAAQMQEMIRSVVVIAALTELAQSAVSDANDIVKDRPRNQGSNSGSTGSSVNNDTESNTDTGTTESPIIEDRPLIETLDDCELIADELGGELVDEYIRAGDVFWYNTAMRLQRFRLTFLELMRNVAPDMPNARKVALKITEPALVVLYRETGDSTQVKRFIQRNAVRHPSFVTGGREVEVINDK